MSFQTEKTILETLDLLWAMALRQCSCREDAEELVQDTCVKALRHSAELERHPNPRAYLLRILRNTFVDHYRVEGNRPRIISLYELEEGDPRAEAPDPSSLLAPQIVRDSLSQEVQSALEALPEELGLVLWMREVEGFRYQEISEILDLPIGTVRSRLARARAQMAASLVRVGVVPPSGHIPVKEVPS